MTVGQLKQLIREALNNVDLNEMARIANGLKLADGWEEKWEDLPRNIKLGIGFKRIKDYLEAHNSETVTLKDLAFPRVVILMFFFSLLILFTISGKFPIDIFSLILFFPYLYYCRICY